MKIVVPCSGSDLKIISKWCDVIIRYGNLANHSISLLPTLAATDEANAAAQRLIDVGIQAEVLKMQIDPYGGWPTAPNSHFYEAARLMAHQNQPWFWMEVDCLPDNSRWADSLASRYTSCGAKFMGNVVPTPYRDDATGKIVKTPDDDTMMIGCSVYPADMFMLPEFQPLMMDFMKGPDSAPTAFDIYLRDVIRMHGRADVKLVDDKWNTERFEFDGQTLKGYSRGAHEGLGNIEIRDRGGEVNPEAVLVHGCKDDSLYNLIMDGLDMASITKKSAPIIIPFKETSQSTEKFDAVFPQSGDARIDRLESQFGELKDLLTKVLSGPTGPQGGKIGPSGVEHPSLDQMKSTTTIEKLVKMISESSKSIKLTTASTELDIPINKLKTIIQSPGSPVKIKALGWLALTGAKV